MAFRQRVYAASPGYFYVHDHDHNYSLVMINGNRPVYSGPSYSSPVGAERYYHYNSNRIWDPSTANNYARRTSYDEQVTGRVRRDDDGVHEFINVGPRGRAPSRRSDINGRRDPDHIIENQRHIVEWIQNLIERDEAMILDAIDLLEQLNPTSTNGGGLSEEVISKFLKRRNCDKDVDNSEICIVCQDDLCQEDGMIAVLDCGHKYHPMCIKRWLREKNVCPLCKATALPLDD